MDASSVLSGSGKMLGPVVVTGTASGATIGGSLTITNAGGTGIDVQAGATNVTIMGVTVSGNSLGMLIEPGSGNMTPITNSTIASDTQGGP
jgi:hypothetical protein